MDTPQNLPSLPVSQPEEKPSPGPNCAVSAGSVSPAIERESLGKIAYEAYRASLSQTTDDEPLPKWDWLDHERQLAFRDAGEAVARRLSQNT